MAKRFTDTELWKQDWFLDMPSEYKLFYFYVKDNCDHAGIFKVNVRTFCRLNEVKVDSNTALEYFNVDKERIILISDSKWLLVDFFVYQYGATMNLGNRVHNSVNELLILNNIDLGSIRGLLELKQGVKDKDKDKDKEKDKDKDNSLS